MRAILPLLAAACLLTLASRGRGEFDAGTGKPTQAARTFGDGMAATQATRQSIQIVDLAAILQRGGNIPAGIALPLVARTGPIAFGPNTLTFAPNPLAFVVRGVRTVPVTPAPQPPIRIPSSVPRPKR